MNLRMRAVLADGMVPPLTRLRSEKNYLKIDYPSRPLRARTLGYKNTGKMCLVRAKILMGGAFISIPRKGRNPKNRGRVRSRAISNARILAQRVARKFHPMNILNYYPVAKDGRHHYYQFILFRMDKKDKTPPRSKGWVFR